MSHVDSRLKTNLQCKLLALSLTAHANRRQFLYLHRSAKMNSLGTHHKELSRKIMLGNPMFLLHSHASSQVIMLCMVDVSRTTKHKLKTEGKSLISTCTGISCYWFRDDFFLCFRFVLNICCSRNFIIEPTCRLSVLVPLPISYHFIVTSGNSCKKG